MRESDYFHPGDRVVWLGKDRGEVLRRYDRHTLVVRWDDPRVGTTLAPSWRGLEVEAPAFAGYEDTVPGLVWDELARAERGR